MRKVSKLPRAKRHPGAKRAERTSPCAGKCRHVWCAGYNAGYEDGEFDGMENEASRLNTRRGSV